MVEEEEKVVVVVMAEAEAKSKKDVVVLSTEPARGSGFFAARGGVAGLTCD